MPPLERLKECVGFTMSGNFLISFLMSTEERYFLGEGILSITMKQSSLITVELQWLEHLWDHENMFESGVVRANEASLG